MPGCGEAGIAESSDKLNQETRPNAYLLIPIVLYYYVWTLARETLELTAYITIYYKIAIFIYLAQFGLRPAQTLISYVSAVSESLIKPMTDSTRT